MFKKIFKIIILSFFFITGYSQAPSIQWQKCYGGAGTEGCLCIKPTSDGGSIACGSNRSEIGGDITSAHGGFDCWIIKIDAIGTLIWQQSLGGIGDDNATSIKQTFDGGYIMAGYTQSNNSGDVGSSHGNTDYWIVKLNSTGSIEWQKTFGGSGIDDAFSAEQTSDGNYIVAGITNSSDGDVAGYHGAGDYWILKLDNTGHIIWQRTLGGTALDHAADIHQTTDGGYIVSGSTSSNDGDVINPTHAIGITWILKLNDAGNIQWQKVYGNMIAYSICQTNDGGYAFTSNCVANINGVTGNHGLEDYWIVKLDANGNMLWQKSMGGSGTDQPYCISPTTDGGIVVAGREVSTDGDVVGNNGGMDYWLVRFSATGTVTWTKPLGGNTSDFGYSVYQSDDMGFIVAGAAGSNNTGDVGVNHGATSGSSDVWIVKLAPDLLPVTLSSFDAVAKKSDVVCKWETQQEQNSSHFLIERSDDAVHFIVAGRVAAAGNSASALSYNFADENILINKTNYLYYRLKMVDIDGKFSSSRIVKISINKNNSGIVLMRNPVKQSLMINVTDKPIYNTTATIINSLGAVVKNILLKEGLQNVDISELAAGNYFIKTNLGSQKFIISK